MNDTTSASGRFLLRVDPGLHAALRAAAEAHGLSLNEYCSRKLASPMTAVAGPGTGAVQRAASLFADELLGVVAFGSWVRGELADSSDVDVLIVLAEEVPIGRDLYRRWDAHPERWEGRAVEPVFVHLPAADSPGSVWLEVAVDGVVLFERGLVVSTALAGLREEIASGRRVRRRVHGQSYWTEAA